jgi:hypothetical protein
MPKEAFLKAYLKRLTLGIIQYVYQLRLSMWPTSYTVIVG